jgi:hypothetical protein
MFFEKGGDSLIFQKLKFFYFLIKASGLVFGQALFFLPFPAI